MKIVNFHTSYFCPFFVRCVNVSDVCWTRHPLAGTNNGTPHTGLQVHKARISALVHGWVFHTTHWQVSDACVKSLGGWRDSCEHPWYRASHGTGGVWVDGEMLDAPFSCRCGDRFQTRLHWAAVITSASSTTYRLAEASWITLQENAVLNWEFTMYHTQKTTH